MVTDKQHTVEFNNQLPGPEKFVLEGSNCRTRLSLSIINSKTALKKVLFYKVSFLLVLSFFTGILKCYPQQQSANYALYANIIYRFTKYIDWPADKKSGDFIIGIIGDSPLYDELKTFTDNKWVHNQKIVIRKFSSSSTFFNCHILFICEDESRSMKKIAAATAGASMLLVSESEGLARKGSGINVIVVDDHLKFEINEKSIKQRNLDVASEFLELGTIVTNKRD